MQKDSLLAIIGGMGPEAGRSLERYIIEELQKVRTITTDQDFCDIIHLCMPSKIPDRADFIFGRSEANPATAVLEIVRLLAMMGRSYGQKVFATVPCNTFHADVIYDPLMQAIQDEGLDADVTLMHFPQETAEGVLLQKHRGKQIGLISTSGTRQSRLYHDYLEGDTIELIEPTEEDQEALDDLIYSPDYGLKIHSHVTHKARTHLNYILDNLIAEGAEQIILGCTELPLVYPQENYHGIALINPNRIVAQRMLQRALNIRAFADNVVPFMRVSRA